MEQPAIQDPLIGLTIGNYQIKSKLGEGGMGSVYLAVHPLIGKQVALKVLHQEFASNRDVVARFFTEAKSVNDIQHPNIVDIVDYGELHIDGGEMVYFIMEFLDGDSLSNLIRMHAPLPPERALAIYMQIADALAASHQTGVVHRDLKPDNVILIKRGRQTDFAKVLDFGIAKLTGDQPGSRRTRTGIVMGTPAYMSPEQCEGRGNVDHRTDIYALGILLYEMITGRVPFTGEGYGEVLVQHLTQAPTRPSTIRAVSPHVEMIVLKALEKNPLARYPSMEEFMKALADPVGYVEANGGLNGFMQAQLVDTGGPIPSSPTPTPSPLSPLTPVPGSLSVMTPAPGMGSGIYSPAGGYYPTPLPQRVEKSKTGLFIGLGLAAVVGIGAIAFFATRGGGGDGAEASVKDPPGVIADDLDVPPEKPPVVPEKPTIVPDKKPEKPPEVPKGPVMVQIKLQSSPKEAEIWVEGEKKARGKTPKIIELEQGTKVSITFKRRGYDDEEIKITPSEKMELSPVELKRKRPVRPTSSSSSSSSSSSGGTDTDGVISPF
ncbi:MAG TPA: serine/threonine-protein kinase [Kofleriaceae bacterium]|nr:serine/threonine-protein kinase [Kofleriaceae bacterium]